MHTPTCRISRKEVEAAEDSADADAEAARVEVEAGAVAARASGLSIIAQLAKALDGDLDRVVRIVKLVGFVNCTPDFVDQPRVINGASDLMVEVFGDKGRHARSAVASPSLPLGVPVEVEAIVEVE